MKNTASERGVIPMTPFSTPMVGTPSLLKERLLRICGPGRRPMGPSLLAAMLLVCLCSVNLVSCQRESGPMETYLEQVKTLHAVGVEMQPLSSAAYPGSIEDEDLVSRVRNVLSAAEAVEKSQGDFSDAGLLSMVLKLQGDGDGASYWLYRSGHGCYLALADESRTGTFEPFASLSGEAMEVVEDLARTQMSRKGGSAEMQPLEEAEMERLLPDYFQERYGFAQVCWYSRLSPQSPEGTMALGPVEFLGSSVLNGEEQTLLRLSMTERRDGGDVPWEDSLVVMTRGGDGALRVSGTKPPDLQEEPLEDTIRRIVWGVSSLETTLFLDGSPDPLSWGKAIGQVAGETPETEEVPDLFGVYGEGDRWVRQKWEGLEAISYWAAATDTCVPYILSTTRTDLATWRGARVGDSRESVQAIYPELEEFSDGEAFFWGIQEELKGQDVLWYNVTGSEMAPEALLFLFEQDTLARIIVHFTFD